MFHDDDTLRYLENMNSPQPKYSQEQIKHKIEHAEDSITLKRIVGLGCIILAMIIFYKLNHKNPIIGRWISVRNTPIIERTEIEFTDKRMYAMGITGEVTYEIDDDKVIVFDKDRVFKDIGLVFRMKDAKTLESDFLGVKTVYKKME